MSESSDDVPLAQLVKKNDDEVKQEPKTQPQEPKAEQAAQNGAAPPAAAAAKQEDDGSSSDEDAPLIVRKAAAKNGEFGAALSSSRRTNGVSGYRSDRGNVETCTNQEALFFFDTVVAATAAGAHPSCAPHCSRVLCRAQVKQATGKQGCWQEGGSEEGGQRRGQGLSACCSRLLCASAIQRCPLQLSRSSQPGSLHHFAALPYLRQRQGRRRSLLPGKQQAEAKTRRQSRRAAGLPRPS